MSHQDTYNVSHKDKKCPVRTIMGLSHEDTCLYRTIVSCPLRTLVWCLYRTIVSIGQKVSHEDFTSGVSP